MNKSEEELAFEAAHVHQMLASLQKRAEQEYEAYLKDLRAYTTKCFRT
jgi:hypothetical protein